MIETVPVPCYICGEMIDTYWINGGGMLCSEEHDLMGDSVCHTKCFDKQWEEYESGKATV